MVWKLLFLISSILLLVFSISDFVGEKKLRVIEKKWLKSSIEYFIIWYWGAKSSYSIWKMLISTLYLATIIPFCILITLKGGLWGVFYFVGFFLSIFIFHKIKNVIVNEELKIFVCNNKHYFEMNYLDSVTDYINRVDAKIEKLLKIEEQAPGSMGRGGSAGIIFFSVFIVGIFTTFILISSFLLRGIRLLVVTLIWFILYSFPLFLKTLAVRLDITHYFNLGKYILLIILTLMSIYRELF